MSGEVLSAGSAQPPLEPGKVRLYGFEYSPYVQRVHMVLIAKNIPHDVKNIDLKNKPDWFLKLNPAGKVPVLDTGDKVLTESLEIVLFLDKNYPGTTLRNTDPEKSAKDREIVEKFEGLRKEFHEGIKNKDYQSPETLAILSLFQSELEKRGTTFLAAKNNHSVAVSDRHVIYKVVNQDREERGYIEFCDSSCHTIRATEVLPYERIEESCLCDMTCAVYNFRKGDVVSVSPRPPPHFQSPQHLPTTFMTP
uniref:GST N-terminal domain-containing protein n=1 Tax=Timema genevievae TaxID=629358 RepID=A0A7R9K172_TIMGE|nr:unnamed protein product [Timema genevievae]